MFDLTRDLFKDSLSTFHFQSIYKFGLGGWVFVCLYLINVKTAEPIGPKFFVGHHVIPGKVYEDQIFKNLPPSKFYLKILKMEMKDGRKAT